MPVQVKCRECGDLFNGSDCQAAADKLSAHVVERHPAFERPKGVVVIPGRPAAPAIELRKRGAAIIREKATGNDADLSAVVEYLEQTNPLGRASKGC